MHGHITLGTLLIQSRYVTAPCPTRVPQLIAILTHSIPVMYLLGITTTTLWRVTHHVTQHARSRRNAITADRRSDISTYIFDNSQLLKLVVLQERVLLLLH
jgi:hypothetical protein